jgi:hypothetical protein
MPGGLRASVAGNRGSTGKPSTSEEATRVDPELEMDRLLEKISRKGMNSLTATERASLEQARQAILQRGGRNSK